MATSDRITFQHTFACTKSTTETLEKGLTCVESKQKRHQNDVTDVVLVSLWLTLNIFHIFFQSFYC